MSLMVPLLAGVAGSLIKGGPTSQADIEYKTAFGAAAGVGSAAQGGPNAAALMGKPGGGVLQQLASRTLAASQPIASQTTIPGPTPASQRTGEWKAKIWDTPASTSVFSYYLKMMSEYQNGGQPAAVTPKQGGGTLGAISSAVALQGNWQQELSKPAAYRNIPLIQYMAEPAGARFASGRSLF